MSNSQDIRPASGDGAETQRILDPTFFLGNTEKAVSKFFDQICVDHFDENADELPSRGG